MGDRTGNNQVMKRCNLRLVLARTARLMLRFGAKENGRIIDPAV
jgi:hypothetical protein